jgi:hypothetical protein
VTLADFVKKIFGDETARNEFHANPEAYVSKLDLTATEKKSILSLQTKTGLVTADGVSLQSNVGPMSGWL